MPWIHEYHWSKFQIPYLKEVREDLNICDGDSLGTIRSLLSEFGDNSLFEFECEDPEWGDVNFWVVTKTPWTEEELEQEVAKAKAKINRESESVMLLLPVDRDGKVNPKVKYLIRVGDLCWVAEPRRIGPIHVDTTEPIHFGVASFWDGQGWRKFSEADEVAHFGVCSPEPNVNPEEI